MSYPSNLDLPTGNGTIEWVSHTEAWLDRDLRDSTGERWYWHVGVQGYGSERLLIRMRRPGLLGGFGPAVSADGGLTYSWLWGSYRKADEFVLSVPAQTGEVRLAATIPYGRAHLERFLARPEVACNVAVSELARSRGGRSVPMLRLPAPAYPKVRLVVACRHHACEAMASYVLEGVMLGLLAARNNGESWARTAELVAVPLIDVDGVEAGDQGKGRLPLDHNRDYGEASRYEVVVALRNSPLLGGPPIVALDLHTPGLRGELEERPFLVASGDPGDLETVRGLARGVPADKDGRRMLEPDATLVLAEPWNSAGAQGPRCFVAWARSRPNTRLAATVEYPNGVDRGRPVGPATARAFGGALASGLRDWIE